MELYNGANERWRGREKSAATLGIQTTHADWLGRVGEEQMQGMQEVWACDFA